MRWLDAVERILRDEGTSMHYEAIATEIMRRSLVDTRSATPGITLHASVSQDIGRRRSAGLAPRFAREGGGLFTLAEWTVGPDEDVRDAVARTREQARRQLLRELRQLSGEIFESFLEVLFTQMGYDVTVTAGSDDEGVDLVAERSGGVGVERVAVQAKRSKANRRIGPRVVRYLRDAAVSRECTSAALVTTSDFDAKAVEVAQEPQRLPVRLIGGTELIDLSLEASVGIRTENLTLVHADLDSVFEIQDEPLGS